MSMRYKGGVLSATAPTTSISSAQGVWTMRQQLQAVGGTGWPIVPPTVIGQAYGGGFYAGKISTAGTGVADYYLIVCPKSSESGFIPWGVEGVTTGATSAINGQTNTATLVALGSAYEAAQHCNNLNAGAGLNSYKDWYMPSKNELEVIFYNLKPTTNANNTAVGANVNAVSPEPYNTNYTSGSPAQTSATDFRSGGSQALTADLQWSSTEFSSGSAYFQSFWTSSISSNGKSTNQNVRAVRRVPV
jgi:hypothetical protein